MATATLDEKKLLSQMSFRRQLRGLIATLLLLAASTATGIFGFIWIEGYTVTDAIYMTVITISTVGYTEVEPLSEQGKIFVSIYIIFNVIIFAYVVSVLTRYLFEGEIKSMFRNIMTDRNVRKLKNHVVVCGYGRNGKKVVEELLAAGKEVVLVEQEEHVIKQIPEHKNLYLIEGDAISEEVLQAAGADKAHSFITALSRDADNVYITLTAREINPKANIIARANEEQTASKLYRAGATHVVIPNAIGGSQMARLVTSPDVVEFVEMLTGFANEDLKLESLRFEDLREEYRNKTIRELDIRKNTGATVVGFKDNKKGFIINPGPDMLISENDTLIIIGKLNEIKKMTQFYFKR